MTADEVRAALSPRLALILTLYGEARGEPLLGQLAAGCSMRNRVRADLNHDGKPNNWWGNTFAEVCLKRWQYSCWWEETSPNTIALYALAERVLQRAPLPDTLRQLAWIADGLIEQLLEADPSQGATHYLTIALYTVRPPDWTRGLAPTARIGNQVYFKAT